ncbi:MAG TPA: FAD-dependent oxidoreductase [Candidatus Omnitrophota bacterium]|nr:FAD-dependent oxidoreductase [Candidatus Omnitrophota bacterium]HPT38747.1 FAD-dependent oxidoreductase [Candidatus Omnitrophota bacterium]
MKIYDLIIVGAGPAGITAGVYAARKRLDFLMVSLDIGGQAAWSGEIENYTGYQFITGPELAQKFQEHVLKYGAAIRENEEVLGLEKTGSVIRLKTNKADYQARSLIIASGKKSKELYVPGEKEFKNRGLTYCATCDGPLFAGREIAVIGGGNSALDAVLQLIRIAKHIYLVNNASHLSGDAVMLRKVEGAANVTVLNNTSVTAVLGNRFVQGIKIKNNLKENELAVQGVFVEIGLIPNSAFVRGVEKNSKNEIVINLRNQTNIPGIFAAGDVTDVPEKQIIIAAGEGAKAALGVFHYLSENNF